MTQHFIAELQRRKVLRVATGYVVGAWIVLQVAVALQTAWALSAAFSGTILNLMIIGFPAAVGLAWFFEITPAGIKRTSASGDGAIAKLQTTDFVLAGALALVFCIGVAQFFWPREAAKEVATAVEQKTADTAKPKAEPPRLGDKSIAVLPFANLSPDKANEYFADGLTEEILNLLAKTGDLKVISRTSSFAFKGKDTPIPEIAKQLGVRHILEGSVRTDGKELRIAAQLVDVESDTQLWSQTYERKLEDVFDLQDKIARDIAEALNVEVTLSNSNGEAPTKSLKAYRLYLEGRNAARRRDDSGSARALLMSAIAEDDQFAEAHAMLAFSYVTSADMAGEIAPEIRKRARAAATAAISLKPKLALGYAMLGWLDRRDWNWVAGMANAERAVALDPSDSYVKYLWASGQFGAGRLEEARALFLDVLRTDPLFDSARAQSMTLDAALGNFAAADQTAATLTKSPDWLANVLAHWRLARAAVDRGDGAAAADHFLSIYPSQRRPFTAAVADALRSGKSGAAARDALAALNAETEASNTTVLPGFLILKAYGPALEYLMALRPAQRGAALFLTWDTDLGAYRNDPRWKTYLREIGLVDYWKQSGWPDRCRAKGEDDFECS